MPTVNIYFLFCDAGDVPAGWTEISATYQNRLIKLDSTSFLATAGADTHTHNVSTKCSLASGGPTNSTGGSSGIWIGSAAHTHTASTAAQSIDAGTETNLPLYKNYRMIYKDSATFDGNVPAHCAVLRAALPNHEVDYDHWGWENNTSSYIRISATYGTTGGANSHTHPCTFAWNTGIVSSTGRSSDGSTVCNKGAYAHAHTSTGIVTDATAHTYKWWGAGVCEATTAASCLPAASYAWFDGTPPAGWTAVSDTYDHRFCRNMGSADRTVQTGGNDATHTHTIAQTSGGCSAGTSQTAAAGSSAALLYTHTHALTGGVYDAVLPVPSNFTLILASNDADIEAMVTRTITYTMDTLLQKTRTKTFTADLLMKKLGIGKTYAMDLLVKKGGLTSSVDMDIMLVSRSTKQLDMDIMLKKSGLTKTYAMDTLLAFRLSATYEMDLLITSVVAKTYAMNLLIKKLNINKTYTMDLILISSTKATYEMDLLIKMFSISKTYQADILLQKNYIKTYIMDLLINKKNISKTYQMSISLYKASIKTYQMNVLLRKTINKRYSCNIIIISSTSSYRKRRMLQMDNTRLVVEIEKGHDAFVHDPIGNEPRQKALSMDNQLEPVVITQGYDAFVHDPIGNEPRQKALSMDNQLEPVVITHGHDAFFHDPIGDEPRQKRDIPATSKHTASTEMTKGFDPFVHDDIPRKKREFSNAS